MSFPGPPKTLLKNCMFTTTQPGQYVFNALSAAAVGSGCAIDGYVWQGYERNGMLCRSNLPQSTQLAANSMMVIFPRYMSSKCCATRVPRASTPTPHDCWMINARGSLAGACEFDSVIQDSPWPTQYHTSAHGLCIGARCFQSLALLSIDRGP